MRGFFSYLAEVNEPDAKFERREIRAGGSLGGRAPARVTQHDETASKLVISRQCQNDSGQFLRPPPGHRTPRVLASRRDDRAAAGGDARRPECRSLRSHLGSPIYERNKQPSTRTGIYKLDLCAREVDACRAFIFT